MLDKKNAISIVSDNTSWINQYIPNLVDQIRALGYQNIETLHKHEDLEHHDIVCLLSYSRIIPLSHLQRNKHNLVVHESALPLGKGFAPLSWQILEGKNQIPITLFEASEAVDDGKIYLQRNMSFQGYELLPELRKRQASETFALIIQFLEAYQDVMANARNQTGESTYYSRRRPQDSKLDTNKTLADQFNLLRVVDNERMPAYFEHAGHRYTLQIQRDSLSPDAPVAHAEKNMLESSDAD